MDITNNTEAVYLFLFGISILASFIDSIAGGGGLLTTPSMLLVEHKSSNSLRYK